MSALGAVLGKRTWLGAGAILLAAAGGCALGALLVVKGVLPEGGALAWGCGLSLIHIPSPRDRG